jgi:hypothetical protein
MDTVVHTLAEFPDLPWHKLDPERCTQDWSFGRGGHGFDDKTYTISMYEGRDVCHIWPIPAPLAAMMRIHSQVAVRERVRAIRDLLSLED